MSRRTLLDPTLENDEFISMFMTGRTPVSESESRVISSPSRDAQPACCPPGGMIYPDSSSADFSRRVPEQDGVDANFAQFKKKQDAYTAVKVKELLEFDEVAAVQEEEDSQSLVNLCEQQIHTDTKEITGPQDLPFGDGIQLSDLCCGECGRDFIEWGFSLCSKCQFCFCSICAGYSTPRLFKLERNMKRKSSKKEALASRRSSMEKQREQYFAIQFSPEVAETEQRKKEENARILCDLLYAEIVGNRNISGEDIVDSLSGKKALISLVSNGQAMAEPVDHVEAAQRNFLQMMRKNDQSPESFRNVESFDPRDSSRPPRQTGGDGTKGLQVLERPADSEF